MTQPTHYAYQEEGGAHRNCHGRDTPELPHQGRIAGTAQPLAHILQAKRPASASRFDKEDAALLFPEVPPEFYQEVEGEEASISSSFIPPLQ